MTRDGISGRVTGMSILRFFVGGLATCMAMPGLAADKPKVFEVAALKFTPPKSTKEVTWTVEAPTSRMRKAQFKVVGAKAEATAQCVFFYFGPGAAGGRQANFARWIKQFSPPPKPAEINQGTREVNKVKVHVLKVNGTYLDGPPFGAKIPKKNYRLYGAIVDAPRGAVFVKMTGPAALVMQAEAACFKMIESALK